MVDFKVVVPIVSSQSDFNIIGNVSCAAYNRYFDYAKSAYFEQLGINVAKEMAMLVNSEISYKIPVRMNKNISVGIKMSRIGTTSFEITLHILDSDDLRVQYVVAKHCHVCFDPNTKKPTPVSDSSVEKVVGFESELILARAS